MVFYLLSQLIRMVFGTLFPAYYSFKAVKNKNPKEYVHWMMYWIVFGFYSVFETFSDAFFGCWFPFYYEVKIIFQLWLLSSTTKGATTLYKIWVHPNLSKYENEIDLFLEDIQGKMKNGVANCGTLAVSYMSESFLRGMLRVQQGFMKTATAVNYHSGGSGTTSDEMTISLSKMSPTTPDFDPFYENASTSTGFFLENPQRKSSRRSTASIKKEKEDDVEDLNMTLDLDDDVTEEIITGTDDTDDSSCPEKLNSTSTPGQDYNLRANRSIRIKPPAGIRREVRRSKKKTTSGGNSSDIPTLPLLPPMSLRNRHSTQQS